MINENELMYYYLYNVAKTNNSTSIKNFKDNLYRFRKELYVVEVKAKSFNYVKESFGKLTITKKGINRKKYLQKTLNIKGIEKFLMPNYERRRVGQLSINDIYLKK